MNQKRQAGPLTAREREVLQLIAAGALNKQIAAAWSVSIRTVEAHRRRMVEKLEAQNAAHAVYKAMLSGILPVGSKEQQEVEDKFTGRIE